MQEITSGMKLKNAIAILEIKHSKQGIALSKQLLDTLDSLKPVNLLKETLKELTPSSLLKGNFADTALGMTTGFIAKKALTVGSKNPLLRLLGIVLEVGVANFVSRHPDGVKSFGERIVKNIFKRKENNHEEI